METSDIIASLSLVISIFAACFALWSALEAKKARKVSQSQELAPHFINIGYLWNFVQEKGGLGKAEIEAGNRSIAFLRAQLSSDQEFLNFIKDLPSWVDKVPRIFVMIIGEQTVSPPPQEDQIPLQTVTAAKEIFEKKQRQYVCIK